MPENANYLRYVLAFEVQRDRMKDPAKTRQTLLELITKSPTNDGYTQNAVSWLLSNAQTEQAVPSGCRAILKAQRDHIHLSSFRNMLAAWAKSARRDKNLKAHADYAKAAADKQNADTVLPGLGRCFGQFFQNAKPPRPANACCSLRRSTSSAMRRPGSCSPARRITIGTTGRATSGRKPRRSMPAWSSISRRMHEAAIEYLQAATDYGPKELAQEAALHLMKFDPPDARTMICSGG